jgi:hypothetical protein
MGNIEITSDKLDKMMNKASKLQKTAKLIGKSDRRTITFKINAKKAELIKLAKLREPLLQMIDDISHYLSSDDNNVLF